MPWGTAYCCDAQTRDCAAAGQLRCQLCAKVVPDHSILAQHLKDKHGGDSAEVSAGGPPEPSLTFSLADLLLAQRYYVMQYKSLDHFATSDVKAFLSAFSVWS